MATTGTTAQALEAAEAELSALETEATLLPRRLLLAAHVGTPLDVAALRARQELLPERLLAARERLLRCRLAHLEAERGGGDHRGHRVGGPGRAAGAS